jgi:hypothetical protein
MNRFTYTIIVVLTTIVVMLGIEGVWIKFHPAPATQTRHVVQKPLSSQSAADAQQAARNFFTAMKDSDWTTLEKFWPTGPGVNKKFDDVFTDKTKDLIGGLEIVSIGTPYKETGNGWTMVPYKVQFKGGDSQTNSLRLQKQSDGQWIWGGGF